MNFLKGCSIALLSMGLLVFFFAYPQSATASQIQYQLEPANKAVRVTMTGVNAAGGIPPGAMHCITGTADQWAGEDLGGGQFRFDMNAMIGRCVDVGTDRTVVHLIPVAMARNGVMCLIPVFVNPQTGMGKWSFHPNDPAHRKIRGGADITVLHLTGNSVIAGSQADADSCD